LVPPTVVEDWLPDERPVLLLDEFDELVPDVAELPESSVVFEVLLVDVVFAPAVCAE
jgi:hypothetical protein